MNHPARRFSWLLTAAAALVALPAMAGTVTGVVRNGTTNQVAPGTPITLIQLQGGMQPVAQTHADAQGRYSFSNPGIGQQPMLVRASYRGVDYLDPVAPGQSNPSVNIDVYDPTTDTSAFHVLHQIVAIEPQGNSLVIGEEFDVQNQTKPPQSFFRPRGSFEFDLPQGADLNQAEAWGPSGMPVVQATVNKGPNRYAIIFPFRPGQNGVRFSYKLDYASQQATLHLSSPYAVQMALILAPPAMKVVADGFSPSGSEHGWAVYTRQGMAANKPVSLSVSGTGPIPTPTSDNGNDGGQGQGQADGGQANSDNSVTAVAQALPPRLDSVRWIVIGGFAAMFILGAFFLWWRSRSLAAVAVAGAGASATVSAPAKTKAGPAPSAPTEDHEGALRQSVDEIKETLFRLELRRQAGTLSEEDYQAQRQRMEKTLRDLVKG
ncbi:MAG TPA: carboxypeptidase-like regulatory domain-containing protein [Candidatus Dormibacteraeota bacterium]|nr:carboxypeptidase-like regulatory domain-containing protein [Candidatus Dormibacteraeota bacterium]